MEKEEKNEHVYILKIKGVKGNATIDGFKGGIKVRDWESTVEFPSAEKETTHGNLPNNEISPEHSGVILYLDLERATNVFAKKIFEGKYFDEAALHVINNQKAYFNLEMKNVLVKKIQLTTYKGPTVMILLKYDTVEWIYTGGGFSGIDDVGTTKAKHALNKNLYV